MKKILSIAMLSIACVLSLFGCDQQNLSKNSDKVTKAEDFESHFYQSDRYTIYLHEDGLTIDGTFINDDRKSILDKVVVSEEMDSPHIHKEFTNAKVEVKGDKYIITADDGVSLEFTKFMNHIIVDSVGMEYIRKAK
ncbi:protein-disulfide isomerase [Solibacillus sp. NPDC093137]|uniref:protein-disulfide isomerase n=1 Tax=Solibacillus sp. NPDC093137 TaxID=3390678 RepID=UPI003CFCDE8A